MSDKQVRAQYTREFKQEAVRQVRSGQAIAVVAKVLGIPKASLGNWVRLSAKGELDGAGGGDKSIQVSPEQMEIARLRAENARLRMERDIAKKSRGVLRAGHAARYAWIHQMRKLYPVNVSCGVLEVSASGTSTGCAGVILATVDLPGVTATKPCWRTCAPSTPR